MNKNNVEELRKTLLKDLPESLNEKLKDVKTNVEFCKILANNGIDVEKLQKELPDEFLSQIGGGYTD